MRVDQNIMEILERSALDGAMLRLPPTQLDRGTYQAVNKIIEAAGGKWNRKAKAHVFDGEAIDTIEPILLTGEYTLTKQDFGQFDSPADVVGRLIELARIRRPASFVSFAAWNRAETFAKEQRLGIRGATSSGPTRLGRWRRR